MIAAPYRLASTHAGRIHVVRVSPMSGFTLTACGAIPRSRLEYHDIGPTCKVCRGLVAQHPEVYRPA